MSTRAMSPRRMWLLASVLLALTFLAGGLAGAAWERYQTQQSRASQGHGRRHFAEMLKQRYHLSAQQSHQVDSILARRRPRVDSLMATVQPQLRAAFDSTNNEIAAVLNPEQRARFRQDQERRRRSLSGRNGSAAPAPAPAPPPAAP